MTGCIWEMQIKYCYALNISWALQAWEKLNVLWLSQCLAPLPYYLYLISHICNYKRWNKTVTSKTKEKDGVFSIVSGLIQTLTVLSLRFFCTTETMLKSSRHCEIHQEKNKQNRVPQELWRSHGVVPGHSDCPPWQEWRWHPAPSSSEIQPRCPNSSSLQIPRAASGGFRDLPADSATELSAEKADGTHRLWTLLHLPGHFQRQGHLGSLPKPLQFQHLLHC